MRQPILFSLLKGYDLATMRADILSGITVALVALPLSLAIAIASGAPPETGLVTAIVAGFFISLLGGSRVQIGGPTGAFIVVVYGVIAEHGYDGLVLATFMAGIVLLIAGFFRAGRLIAFIPDAVVQGFTIGIALIIATSQLANVLGLTIQDLPADFLHKLPVLWSARADTNLYALAVAVATMVLIVVLRRTAPRWPGLIAAIAVTSGLVALANLPVETLVSRFGALPSTPLPWPKLPELNLAHVLELVPSALIIAFLAGVESLLSAMVADRMTDSQHRPNAELNAQGVANLASALFGGLPATGAIARTATNIKAGGRTPVAGIVHALTILLVMLIAAPMAGYMAMPALAGLLLITAWNMSEPHKWRDYAKARAGDRGLLVLTLVLTVAVDLTVAIGVGVALGLALRLRRRSVSSDWHTPER